MPIAPSQYLAKRSEAACDTECYIDYWSIGFENLETGKQVIVEKYAGLELDRTRVRKIFMNYRIYTFNGLHYDLPMIMLAMSGASNQMLKEASDAIIVGGLRSWQFYDRYDLVVPDFIDLIDLFDVAPGVKLSLKKYGARMNMKRLQELPIDPSEHVGPARRPLMRRYLGNDLNTTSELARNLKEEIDLRNEISAEYNIDVRSKSDAQIAETLIAAEVFKLTGRKADKPVVREMNFKYEPPAFIKFKTPLMRDVLRVVTETSFHVSDKPDPPKAKKKYYGVVRLPDSIKALQIRIGFTDYKMGIGGLHSQEKQRSYVADEDTIIEDRDVRAYYPRLMLACGYVPAALGKNFLGVFTKFVNLRDSYKEKAAVLKKAGDTGQSLKYKKRSDSFKIVNNGTFGKTGSPYAVVYAPKLLISTTLTGQLSLLMLIEELELRKFSVISANTDGIVTVIPRERYGLFASIVLDWELDTSFSTEAVRYAGVYSRDVNSYVAVPDDYLTNPKAETKRKGLFAKAGLQAKHDPTFDICSTAVVEYLMHGTDIEETIMACDDITQFIGVKQVMGGGLKDGEYLGKMVRWYYGDGERGFIAKKNGARVAGTTGAVPCMDLPDEFPDDIDFNWYIREAYARMHDIGITARDPRHTGRQGFVYAMLPKQKTAHVIDAHTMVALCGRKAPNVREPWNELKFLPNDTRVCKACQEERGFVDKEDDDDAL